MKIIEWPRFLENGIPFRGKPPEQKFISVTIGVFDGVHRGHRCLIERVVSHNADYTPVVVTFRQNHKTEETGSLQTFHQKIEVLEQLGIKITLAIDFTESFRRMAGIEFLEILLKHGRIGFFAVGSAFRCGYRLDTDADAIQKFFSSHNIPSEIVPEVMEDGLPISSSRIRSAIAGGDFALAEKMLGRPLSMTPKTS
jgi:riboflavin kinase/FMN adenylyltransferase